jgi:hypothetical protein
MSVGHAGSGKLCVPSHDVFANNALLQRPLSGCLATSYPMMIIGNRADRQIDKFSV